MQDEDRENKGDTTDAQCSTSVGQLPRDTETRVEQKPKFETDLRVEGVPQYAILKAEEQMKEINKNVREFEQRFMYKIHS